MNRLDSGFIRMMLDDISQIIRGQMQLICKILNVGQLISFLVIIVLQQLLELGDNPVVLFYIG
ncbi:MAG: hypothetical protein GWN62_36010 [Aliifodinibius sp.]|nr:hypothetical protein [Fodinibius sp.]